MHGVSKITTGENIMLVSYTDVSGAFMCEALASLAGAGIVIDMISQTPPLGKNVRFSFTASYADFDKTLKALGAENRQHSPLISGGYSKINLYGEDMVDSVGVAARALAALATAGLEPAMITTSDLDISLLMRQEDVDVACVALQKTYSLL